MTLKEAWNGLLERIKNYAEIFEDKEEQRVILKQLDIIRPHLVPPTADEVIKALRGELNWLIIYDEKKKSFCHIDTANLREIQAIYMRDNKLYVSQPLSPSTITLIGRFYEGLEVKE